jgi:DNA-binding MarR family transcriptional regulator
MAQDLVPGAGSLLDDLTFLSLLAVTQAGMWILADLETILATFGLSHGRFSLLLVALDRRNQPVLASRLASMLGKSKPTVSRMVARLESDGLIRSHPDELDARAKQLTLTDAGRQLLDRVIPEVNQRGRLLAERIDDNEKEMLLPILSKLQFDDPERTIRCLP